MTKHQKQTVVLILALIVFAAIFVYNFRDSILPKPVIGDEAQVTATMDVSVPNLHLELFDRPDFRSLKSFTGKVSMPTIDPKVNPFRAVEMMADNAVSPQQP